jgi:hypothetical protein
MRTLLYRAMGAAVLDAATYESVEHERPAALHAVAIVLLAGLAAGVGATGVIDLDGVRVLAVAAIACGLWLAWASLILYVGGQAMKERQTRTTYSELLRTIGFAASPGILQVLAVIRPIAIPVFVITWIWMLAAMVVAVRQALDFRTTAHAFAVCLATLGVVLATVIALSLAFQQPVA